MAGDYSTDEQLFPRDLGASPRWASERQSGVRRITKALWSMVRSTFLQYVMYKANKGAYLRHLGVRIGKDCSILNRVKDFGSEPWLIELGNRMTITGKVSLITHDGSSRIFRDRLAESSVFGNRFGTIRILDNTFVGVGSIILPDVQIGPNSIVGAGSVLNKDVPQNTVVAGVPAREICTLEEYVERYRQKMVPIESQTVEELRRELTRTFWGEVR